ncbi:MAG: Methionine aminopeptidase [Parcubacteria group bacterium GW2011_GWA2_33_14]|nr:MAG: Methionine aminopeptidase [Parcubacteria group bacterium GW2011_GWA2_33_14]
MNLIKTSEEIKIIAEGGKILATVLSQLEKMVKPGITTLDLDRAAEALILMHKAKPAFKGYEKFPYSLCTSVNEDIVHGFPSNRVLKEGDIIGLDLGVLYKGYNSDMAVTVPVGKVSFEAARLIMVTKKALKRGIKKVRAGNTTGDIGNTIQRYIEDQGYGVVRELCGHGIGKEIHEDPHIPNYGQRHKGVKLQEGMVICIEPMVTIGSYQIKKSKDSYGYATKDGSLSAHFEYTIAVTKSGAKVLTSIL